MSIRRLKSGKKRITLHDVIAHMNHMEQRLTLRIDANSAAILSLDKRVDALGRNLTGVEVNLTRRIDALDDELTATLMDILKIYRHVGIPIAEDD
jgi:hypothetical protein